MRFKDLLYFLYCNFDIRPFNSAEVSQELQFYSRTNPGIYLVDNPKGLTTKWVSNDLNRLYAMSFINRTREKRPITIMLGSVKRGFQYSYFLSNRGLDYAQRMQREGFMLGSIPQYPLEAEIFRQVENFAGFDLEKAAMRHRIRAKIGIVPPIDSRISRLHLLLQQNYLAQEDQRYRKGVGYSRRFGGAAILKTQNKQLQWALDLEIKRKSPGR